MENERLLKTEMANALSHGIGIVLALAFAPLVISMADNSDIKYLGFGTAAYCFGLFMVFVSSTLYHAVLNPIAKRVLRVFDHISIFFLIGGSYIPFIILFTDSDTAQLFFIVQWSLIALGIIKKVFYTGRFRLLSSLIYILIGCMIFFFDRGFWGRIPDIPFYFLVAGGLSYLVGVVFYQNEKYLITTLFGIYSCFLQPFFILWRCIW